MNKEYLGDGVYAEIEDGMIRLETMRVDGLHYIYFEPEVYRSLRSFMARNWPTLEAELNKFSVPT